MPNKQPSVQSEDQSNVKEILHQAQGQVRVTLSELKQRFAPLDELIQKTTREHPYVVVLSAAAGSFLSGFFVRRRTALGAGAMLGFFAGCWLSTQTGRLGQQILKN